MHRKQLRAIGDRLLRLILIHKKIELVENVHCVEVLIHGLNNKSNPFSPHWETSNFSDFKQN